MGHFVISLLAGVEPRARVGNGIRAGLRLLIDDGFPVSTRVHPAGPVLIV